MTERSKTKTSTAVSLIIAFVLGGAAFFLLLWSSGVAPSLRSDLSSIDVITIVLSALGVMVAILTLFLGVLAFYGWATFRSIIEERFDEAVRQRFDPSKDEYKALLTKVIEDAKSIQLTQEAGAKVPKLKSTAKPITDEIK